MGAATTLFPQGLYGQVVTGLWAPELTGGYFLYGACYRGPVNFVILVPFLVGLYVGHCAL